MSNKAVAQLLHLHAHTVKDLDIRYMQAWLAKTPQPAPRVIGVDELSIEKGHTYRIVVSDLERGRPIGSGRAETRNDLVIQSSSTWAERPLAVIIEKQRGSGIFSDCSA